MEFLTAYDEDSNSDDKDLEEEEEDDVQSLDELIVQRLEVPENRIDFFGLDSSEDDVDYNYREDVAYGHVYAECPGYVDTLISAYQLREMASGPDVDDDANSIPPPKKPRRPQQDNTSTHVEDLTDQLGHEEAGTDVAAASPISSSTVNNANIFLPEPRAVKSCDRSSRSKLPRRPKRRLVGHDKCVNTLQWGSIESNCTHLLLSSSMDGCVRIWNAISGRCVWNRAMSKPDAAGTAAVRCARWSNGGRTVATGGYDKMARLVDVETDVETFTAAHQHYVSSLRFHPSEHHLLVCGNTGRIDCWDTRSPADQSLVRTYRGDFAEVQDLEFLPGGSEMVSCTNLVTRDSANRTIMAWDFFAGAVLSNQIFNERYHCTSLRVHPLEKHFLAQTNGNYVALFSVDRPYRIDKKKRFEGHKVDGYWVGIGISRDGRFVYSGSSDGRLHAYDFRTSERVGRWGVSESPCLAVECHPLLDSTVAVSDMKGDVHIWQ